MYHIIMQPTYNLKEIKELIRAGHYLVTQRALMDALEDFDFTEDRIIQEVLNLRVQDLDKTMPSEKKPDLWQDAYKKQVIINREMQWAYIKLNIVNRKDKDIAVMISFHKA